MTSHSSILFRLRRNCRQLFATIVILRWSDHSSIVAWPPEEQTSRRSIALLALQACWLQFYCAPQRYMRIIREKRKPLNSSKEIFCGKLMAFRSGIGFANRYWCRDESNSCTMATHFVRCLVRELQLLENNGRLMLGVCVCLTGCFRRYKWHRG